jgi:hypothetical protein
MAGAHVGDHLAVVADQVVRQAVLELEEELGAGDDFPSFVSRRVVAGVQHAFVTTAFDSRDAALHELGEGDRADRGAGFVRAGGALSGDRRTGICLA